MDLQLKGQHALVSGSTAGIGYAIADALAAEGAVVTINGRTTEGTERAKKKLLTAHPHAEIHAVVADAGTAEGCNALANSSQQFDILVNNMGIFDPKPFATIPDAAIF